jgi:iron complex outermembrane recepter protein
MARSNNPAFFPAAYKSAGHFTNQSGLLRLSPWACALFAGWTATSTAQTVEPIELPAITVTQTRQPAAASISGFADVPLNKAPFQAQVFDQTQLQDGNIQSVADLTHLDPAISDAYNAVGYWSGLIVRGYRLDPKYNYRRDGLPISAETRIPLVNKEAVEVLKGTSGMQAGISSPGGMVNYIVKRPLAHNLTRFTLEGEQPGTWRTGLDLSRRFGLANEFGLRVNVEAGRVNPPQYRAKGESQLLAIAADWRLNQTTLIEAEIENSHHRQPTVPGFSLLGTQFPFVSDPRINLNNQAWSLPTVFNATTASLRWTQLLNDQWTLVTHFATQRLKTDDRVAFPFGCSAENNYSSYCSDGTFDLYDFRSENERRRNDGLQVTLQGQFKTAFIEHDFSVGLLHSRVKNRFQLQAYNFAGTGNVLGTAMTSPAPNLGEDNTQRDEKSTELFIRNVMKVNQYGSLWAGLRHTRLERATVSTSGTQPLSYTQSLTTPWFALSHAWSPETTVYISWGQGLESLAVPNQPRFTNAAQLLSALKSRQLEAGIKSQNVHFDWSLATFDIERPTTSDLPAVNDPARLTRALDGTQHHLGMEGQFTWRHQAWTVEGSAQWLHARREDSQLGGLNGKQPPNVPEKSFRLLTRYQVPTLTGLQLRGLWWGNSSRMATEDNSTQVGGYSVVDLGARYQYKVRQTNWLWHMGIDNVFNRKAWRESPVDYGHTYLFSLQPRQLFLKMEISL